MKYNQNIIGSKYDELFTAINKLIIGKQQVIIAIDGSSASGKTTLADALSEIFDCNIFRMDNFFLTSQQKTPQRFKEAGGNVDYERFKEQVLKKIASQKAFSYQPYNCKSGALDVAINVIAKKLNVIEGVYSMHPNLIAYYDLKVFLTNDEQLQKQRILNRNGEIMLNRFLNEWIPLENNYFSQLQIKSKCDFVY